MADKKKTSKPKKLHPGGSVPGLRPVQKQLTPAQQRLQRRGMRRGRKQDREIAQAGGFKSMRQMQAAMARMTPEQRMEFQRKNATQFREISDRNRGEFEKRNAKLLERVRRQQQRSMRQQNPMMPTAGISQGRPIRGRTPMPGPVPNAEAMKRMQKLMAEQQKRYNERMKNNPNMRTVPIKDMIDPKSLPTLDDAMRAKLRQSLPARNQLLLDQMRNRPKRKPRTTNKR